MRRLPPLTALRSFEAVARLGTARAAAGELSVTQSAVSHNLANLERYLGAPLFHRHRQRLVLTDAGRDYLTRIRPAFDRIEEATWEATQVSDTETLTIAAPASFLALWLIPRIPGFWRRHPNLNLRFLERMTIDETTERFDCAIEYRFQPDRDHDARLLLSDEIVPLAAPDLIAEKGLAGLEDLRAVALIETERRLVSWRAILKDRDWLGSQRFLTVNLSVHAFEAAKVGAGVALGNRVNAGAYLARQDLAVPFAIPEELRPPTPNYYVTCPHEHRDLPKVAAFTSWLGEEMAFGQKNT